MPARRSRTLPIVVVAAGLLLFVPPLLVWSGALGDADTLEQWADRALFRVGLGDGSRLVIHYERGKLEVQVVHGELVRVLLDGEDVPAERLLREGEQLTVLRADGSAWGDVSLDLEAHGAAGSRAGLAGLAELAELHGQPDERMQQLSDLVRDDVASHMTAALAALDPPLPAPARERLAEAALHAAEACLGRIDRTVTVSDPDEAGLSAARVKLDRDDLVEEFADAFEDALSAGGTPLTPSDVTRVRKALSRAVFELPELEYRLGPVAVGPGAPTDGSTSDNAGDR
jgi:hypothetical protein